MFNLQNNIFVNYEFILIISYRNVHVTNMYIEIHMYLYVHVKHDTCIWKNYNFIIPLIVNVCAILAICRGVKSYEDQ